MRNSTLNVAIAQIECRLKNVESNKATHLRMIAEARAAKADLLLFPELSLTGYRLEGHVLDVAIPRTHEIIFEIAQAAKDITVVFGFVEEAIAAQLYNSAIAVRNGKIVFVHRKLNLPTYGALEEGKLFSQGTYVETFLMDDPWRISTLICADLWNPALVHMAMLHGTTVLLAPVNSAIDAVGAEFDNPDAWRKAIDFYSLVYGTPILMANRVGDENGVRFWGHSRIVDAFGKTIIEASESDEEIIYATLDYASMRKARFLLPTVRDSNLDLVEREVNRLIQKIGVPTFVRDD